MANPTLASLSTPPLAPDVRRLSLWRPRVRSRARDAFAAVLLASALAGGPARAQSQLWSTNGQVDAIVTTGNRVYAGGLFTYVGPATGGGAAFDEASGVLTPGFPHVVGTVLASAPDGYGGWYIGGSFTEVGGIPRRNVAHIRPGNTISAWNPNAGHRVLAIAVSGSKVYVGGDFTEIGGQFRACIAELDAIYGTATAWDPHAQASVNAIAVSGNTVYAGGNFIAIGGQSRNGIAALDAITGLATPWNPNPNGSVRALAVSGSTVYAGGGFTTIGGQSRSGVAAIDSGTGLATGWNPNAGNLVLALAVQGPTVYAGGWFTSIGGQARASIAALDSASGLATAWNPGAGGYQPYVSALCVRDSSVFAGGNFTSIGGQPRKFLANLDRTTGIATAWEPEAGAAVRSLTVSEARLYVGGDFTSVGGRGRNNLAAFDAVTGAATDWNPNCDEEVYALAVGGQTLYAGGKFSSVSGQTRAHVAAFDVATGAVTPWNPGFINTVYALASDGGTIYAGGLSGLYAIDANGAFKPWNPSPSGEVRALALNGTTLYVGGYFNSIGGQPRNSIAALDIDSGLATSWNPDAGTVDYASYPLPSVWSLAVRGSVVYAGGRFNGIGGQVRANIAALETASGAATSWNPGAGGRVASILPFGSTIHVGGQFGGIGGQPSRNYLAALDASTGLASVSSPTLNGPVNVVAVGGTNLLAGGNFTTMNGVVQSFIGSVGANVADVSPGALDGARSARAWPNPFTSTASIEFSSPAGARVHLVVFDVAGRRVWRSAESVASGGWSRLSWDGADAQGRLQGAGLYFLSVQGLSSPLVRSVVRVK